MEPKQHELAPRLEQTPLSEGVDRVAKSYEQGTDTNHERSPEVGQVQAEVAQLAMPALPVPVLASDSAVPQQVSSDDTTMMAAGDDDLIEKEWVDKAKSIIAATKDNPYKREQEINRLQIEYIRKRYGRTIGDSGD